MPIRIPKARAQKARKVVMFRAMLKAGEKRSRNSMVLDFERSAGLKDGAVLKMVMVGAEEDLVLEA